MVKKYRLIQCPQVPPQKKKKTFVKASENFINYHEFDEAKHESGFNCGGEDFQ